MFPSYAQLLFAIYYNYNFDRVLLPEAWTHHNSYPVVHRNWNFAENLPLTDELIRGGFSRDGWRNSQLNLVLDRQKELVRGRCGGKKKRQTWNAKGSGLTSTTKLECLFKLRRCLCWFREEFPWVHSHGQLFVIETLLLCEICEKEARMKNAVVGERQL